MYDKNDIIPKVLKALEGGHGEMQAVTALGMEYGTWWTWKDADETLQERVNHAKRSRIALLEDSIYKAGITGDWRAAVTWLEKHDKGWRDRLKDAAGNKNTLIFNGRARELFDLLSEENKQKLLIYIGGLAIGTETDMGGIESGA